MPRPSRTPASASSTPISGRWDGGWLRRAPRTRTRWITAPGSSRLRRNLDRNRRVVARTRFDMQPAARRLGGLPHSHQCALGMALFAVGGGGETDAVVADAEKRLALSNVEQHPHRARVGVRSHAVERLLDDPHGARVPGWNREHERQPGSRKIANGERRDACRASQIDAAHCKRGHPLQPFGVVRLRPASRRPCKFQAESMTKRALRSKPGGPERRAQTQKPAPRSRPGFFAIYFRALNAHYHRRKSVSRSCWARWQPRDTGH